MADEGRHSSNKGRFHVVEGVRVSLDVSYKVSTALPRAVDVYARHLRRHERGKEKNPVALAAQRIRKHSQRWRPDAQWELEDAEVPMQCVEKSLEGKCMRQERLPCDENPAALICSKDNRPRPKKKLRRPMVSVVLDDVGVNTEKSKLAIALANKITLSFLPYAPNVKAQAEAAAAAGHELMLHMPMQPFGLEKDPGESVLRTDMSKTELQDRVRWAMDQFDGFVGVNNHMGSQFTSQALEGMETVLTEFQRKGVFYLDSLTASDSLGPTTAAQLGMPHASRDVFLDVEDHPEFVKKQLKELERLARRNNHAIAIGHPKDATLEALKEWLPTLERRGFKLVQLADTLSDTKARRAEAASVVLEHMRQQHMLTANPPLQLAAPAAEASVQTPTKAHLSAPSTSKEVELSKHDGEQAGVMGSGPKREEDLEPASYQEELKAEIARRRAERAAMDERRKAHATASPSVTVSRPKVLPARPGPMSGRAARERTPLGHFPWSSVLTPSGRAGQHESGSIWEREPARSGGSIFNLAMPLARPATELFRRLLRPNLIPAGPEPMRESATTEGKVAIGESQSNRASKQSSPWPFSRMQSPSSGGSQKSGGSESPSWLLKRQTGRAPVLRPGKAITEGTVLALPDLGLRVKTGLPFDDDEEDSYGGDATAQNWTPAGAVPVDGTPEGDPVLWGSSSPNNQEGVEYEADGTGWERPVSGKVPGFSRDVKNAAGSTRKSWKLRPPMRPLQLQGSRFGPLQQVWRLEPGLGLFPAQGTPPVSAKCMLLDLLAGASQSSQLQELGEMVLSRIGLSNVHMEASSSRNSKGCSSSTSAEELPLSDSSDTMENLLHLTQHVTYPHESHFSSISSAAPNSKVPLNQIPEELDFSIDSSSSSLEQVPVTLSPHVLKLSDQSDDAMSFAALAEGCECSNTVCKLQPALIATSEKGQANALELVVVVDAEGAMGSAVASPGGWDVPSEGIVGDMKPMDVLRAEALCLEPVNTVQCQDTGLVHNWSKRMADEEGSPNTVLALRASIGSESELDGANEGSTESISMCGSLRDVADDAGTEEKAGHPDEEGEGPELTGLEEVVDQGLQLDDQEDCGSSGSADLCEMGSGGGYDTESSGVEGMHGDEVEKLVLADLNADVNSGGYETDRTLAEVPEMLVDLNDSEENKEQLSMDEDLCLSSEHLGEGFQGPEADSGMVVSAGFVVVHKSAWTEDEGCVELPSGKELEAPAGVAEVEGVVADAEMVKDVVWEGVELAAVTEENAEEKMTGNRCVDADKEGVDAQDKYDMVADVDKGGRCADMGKSSVMQDEGDSFVTADGSSHVEDEADRLPHMDGGLDLQHEDAVVVAMDIVSPSVDVEHHVEESCRVTSADLSKSVEVKVQKEDAVVVVVDNVRGSVKPDIDAKESSRVSDADPSKGSTVEIGSSEGAEMLMDPEWPADTDLEEDLESNSLESQAAPAEPAGMWMMDAEADTDVEAGVDEEAAGDSEWDCRDESGDVHHMEDSELQACTSDDDSEQSGLSPVGGGFAAVSLPSGETAFAFLRAQVAPTEETPGEEAECVTQERQAYSLVELKGKVTLAGKKGQTAGKSVVNWLWRGGMASNTQASSRVVPCPPAFLPADNDGTNAGVQ